MCVMDFAIAYFIPDMRVLTRRFCRSDTMLANIKLSSVRTSYLMAAGDLPREFQTDLPLCF